MQELWQTFDAVLGGGEASALLVVGPPRCGKTEFAFEALMRALERNHGGGAMMTVSGRVTADRLGDRAIRRMGASMKARPVTTLSALAFAVIADARRYEDLPAPRLLNGAEQDALLRRVVAAHLDHAEAGNLCDTCVLLREYFADDRWTDTVAPASFVDQLRDMLARINELGASFAHEREYVGEAAGTGRNADRTAVQWRLAFALRREYVRAIEHTYPGEYRLDASRLLVEAAAVLRRVQVEEVRLQPETVPSVLVVDDFHDATLAGLRFLEALSAAGVRLVLVGNPDEAVQTFRGSYPEYLMGCAVRGPLHAALHRIPVSDTPADAAARRPIATSWPRASHCRSLRRSRMTRRCRSAPASCPDMRAVCRSGDWMNRGRTRMPVSAPPRWRMARWPRRCTSRLARRWTMSSGV